MSDALICDWVTSEQLLLIGPTVQGRLNVDTIVTKTGNAYRSFNFLDHDTEFGGPIEIIESNFSTKTIEEALRSERFIVLDGPHRLSITRSYERLGDATVTLIDEIRVHYGDGRQAVLGRNNAAYPISLVLETIALDDGNGG